MKGEKNGYEHCLFFSTMFSTISETIPLPEPYLIVLMDIVSTWASLCLLLQIKPFPKQALVFTRLLYMSFENTVGKRDIAREEQFLFFPVFSTLLKNFLPFSSNLRLSSANSFSMDDPKIFHLVD